MDNIELTNKLYKLTLLFPKKEPLRYKVRETADDILANLIAFKTGDKREISFILEKDLEVINSYFEIAKWQNWVNYFEVLEIQEEYARIKAKLIGQIMEEKHEEPEVLTLERSLKGEEKETRKDKIINILKKVERIQVGEINKLFPGVSKRTIRRDFQKMVSQGVIERIGEKNDTYYRFKESRT